MEFDIKKDMFKRELKEDDKCIKVSAGNNFSGPKIEVVTVQRFTPQKVQIGERRYVDPGNLIKLTTEGLY